MKDSSVQMAKDITQLLNSSRKTNKKEKIVPPRKKAKVSKRST